MHILHVTPTYLPATEWGGLVLTLDALLHGLREQGARVTVLTTTARGAARLPEHAAGEHVVDGIPTVYVRVRGPRRFAWAPGLARELRRRVGGVDLVHVHGLWTHTSLAAGHACRAAGVPYVVTLHGMLLDWAMAQKSWKKSAFRSLFQDRLLRGAAALHCTSTQEREELPARYRALPTRVIPNPIRIDDLVTLPPSRPDGEGTLRLLIAGRIHPVKGFDRLVPALARLRDDGVAFRLRIAGGDEGGYRSEVERLAREQGIAERLEFTGNLEREALAREYERADLLVMPSYQENFGMSAAEAMAAGRPVVVSPGVNLAADIAAAGAGLVAGPAPEELARAILELAKDPARRAALGAAGRRMVRSRYSPEAVASDMLTAWTELIGR